MLQKNKVVHGGLNLAWFILIASTNKEYLLQCPGFVFHLFFKKKKANHAAAPGSAQTSTTPALWEGERERDSQTAVLMPGAQRLERGEEAVVTFAVALARLAEFGGKSELFSLSLAGVCLPFRCQRQRQ